MVQEGIPEDVTLELRPDWQERTHHRENLQEEGPSRRRGTSPVVGVMGVHKKQKAAVQAGWASVTCEE